VEEFSDVLAIVVASLGFSILVGCHKVDDYGYKPAQSVAVQPSESVRPDPEPNMSAAEVVAEQRAGEESNAADLSDSLRMRIVAEQQAAEAEAVKDSPRMKIVAEQQASKETKKLQGDKESP